MSIGWPARAPGEQFPDSCRGRLPIKNYTEHRCRRFLLEYHTAMKQSFWQTNVEAPKTDQVVPAICRRTGDKDKACLKSGPALETHFRQQHTVCSITVLYLPGEIPKGLSFVLSPFSGCHFTCLRSTRNTLQRDSKGDTEIRVGLRFEISLAIRRASFPPAPVSRLSRRESSWLIAHGTGDKGNIEGQPKPCAWLFGLL